MYIFDVQKNKAHTPGYSIIKKKKKDCPVGFSKIVWRSGEFLVSLPCALEPSSWPGLPLKW